MGPTMGEMFYLRELAEDCAPTASTSSSSADRRWSSPEARVRRSIRRPSIEAMRVRLIPPATTGRCRAAPSTGWIFAGNLVNKSLGNDRFRHRPSKNGRSDGVGDGGGTDRRVAPAGGSRRSAICHLFGHRSGRALGGCSSSGLPGGLSGAGVKARTVAFESIDGPPETVFSNLVQQLNQEAQARQVSVVSRKRPRNTGTAAMSPPMCRASRPRFPGLGCLRCRPPARHAAHGRRTRCARTHGLVRRRRPGDEPHRPERNDPPLGLLTDPSAPAPPAPRKTAQCGVPAVAERHPRIRPDRRPQ